MNIPRLTLFIASLFLFACGSSFHESEEGEKGEQSGAGLALEAWSRARMSPNEYIQSDRLLQAFNFSKKYLRSKDQAQWKSIGPKNIGGRTLCLAFHPTDPNIMYAGSASGGLWKTYSSGIGYNAWTQVPINLPVYSIASILISPRNPDIMFLGTGEVYNKSASIPGIIDRFTRGTYGMGILKTTNGGKTWTQCLVFSPNIISGVANMVFDPYDDQILYAATTQGLYKSTNQGLTWTLIDAIPMAVDVDVNQKNPEIIFVTHGSYFDNEISGIYRSNNSGGNFTKLKFGLPDSYSGKAKVDISKSNADIMYASIADALRSIGLYMSVDGGNTWDVMNKQDVANVQGWYSHDVAVDPTNPNYVSYVGQNAYISDHKGKDFINASSWDAGDMGRVPVGGPEGIDIYVHADIHGTYFHPTRTNEIYFVTDGGIFMSPDKGNTFEGRNGGYQTTQFYANFSASRTDPKYAVGGMQDNGTAIYDGQDGWIKVIGGDGMCTGINPANENTIYGTYQYFGLNKSSDRGKTFDYVRPSSNQFQAESKAFNTPFEIIPSSPGSIYAGAQRIYLNENNGNISTWKALHNNPLDENAVVLAIGVSPTDPSTLFASTSPLPQADPTIPKLYKSASGGTSWYRITGLPIRTCMDISFDPSNGQVVYAVFSGFGANSHVFKSLDVGETWNNIDNGLPDVPTNCIAINPKKSNEIYVGNDLGVFFSSNGGQSWDKFMEGLPTAVMAMSIVISPEINKIKIATHGNGVYESPMAVSLPNKDVQNPNLKSFSISPNPANDYINVVTHFLRSGDYQLNIVDMQGRVVYQGIKQNNVIGINRIKVDTHDYASGIYTVLLSGVIKDDQSPFALHRSLVKN